MIPKNPHDLKVTLLKAAIESLSIPPGIYDKAVERYKSVTAFLEKPGTRVAAWNPSQFVQGSAALGLAIRPLGKDDFDFDVSCEVTPPAHLTSNQVRKEVEARLREDANYARMLNTSKMRCLRLDYAEAEKFHLDIVVGRIARWLSMTGTAVQIPDKAAEQWVGSDPRSYIEWFKVRQKVTQCVTALKNFSNVVEANVAPAPEQPEANEKMPLQWVIQAMKRHRDLSFQGQSADAPISVIITTLAAKAYQGELDGLDALRNITARMLDQFDDAAGRSVVLNPTLPSENFADKWPLNPQRRRAFFEWHETFTSDVQTLLVADKIVAISGALEKLVGDAAKNAAFAAHASAIKNMQDSKTLGVSTAFATLGSTVAGARPMPAHTNFGGNVP
jgi:Second Messenger Oligonucleotide or Dinucleotide Synthetase domain